jgi:hypothetical protein
VHTAVTIRQTKQTSTQSHRTCSRAYIPLGFERLYQPITPTPHTGDVQYQSDIVCSKQPVDSNWYVTNHRTPSISRRLHPAQTHQQPPSVHEYCNLPSPTNNNTHTHIAPMLTPACPVFLHAAVLVALTALHSPLPPAKEQNHILVREVLRDCQAKRRLI